MVPFSIQGGKVFQLSIPISILVILHLWDHLGSNVTNDYISSISCPIATKLEKIVDTVIISHYRKFQLKTLKIDDLVKENSFLLRNLVQSKKTCPQTPHWKVEARMSLRTPRKMDFTVQIDARKCSCTPRN